MIEELTPREFNNELAKKQAKAACHYAITQNECYHAFWNRDPQVIIASLNSNIPLALERFTGNTELGEAVNSQLARTPHLERCITTMPIGYKFNGTEFTYTAPIAESESGDSNNQQPLENDENDGN